MKNLVPPPACNFAQFSVLLSMFPKTFETCQCVVTGDPVALKCILARFSIKQIQYGHEVFKEVYKKISL